MNRGSFLQEGRNWMAWLAEFRLLDFLYLISNFNRAGPLQGKTIHDFMIVELGNRHLCNTVLSSCSHRVTWNSCVMLAPGPSLLSEVPIQFGPQYNVSGATWQLASSGPVIQSSSKIRAANLTIFVSHHSIPCPEQRKSPCKANASGRFWRRRTPERVIQFSWPVFSTNLTISIYE